MRRQVVAFVDNHPPIITDAVGYDTLTNETLNHSDIEQAGRLASAAADSSDRLRGQIEERRKALDPLIE